MRRVLVGAICSMLVLLSSNCTKDNTQNTLSTEIGSKASTNIWTGTGNPKLSETPTFYQIDGTTSFQFDGKITGLGNVDNATITIDAVVMVDPSCFNPGNGNLVKGVSKPVNKSVTKTYQLRNGRFDFSVNTEPVTVEDLGSICPNENWRTQIDAVSLVSYTIKLNGIDFYSYSIN